MKLVRQPKGSNLCGQACVATLGGIDLEHAKTLCRSDGRTRTGHLIGALRCLGIDCGANYRRGFPKSGDAILRFTYPNGGGSHWVVWYHGKYYDPASGVFRKVPKYLKESTVTSHLEIQCTTK